MNKNESVNNSSSACALICFQGKMKSIYENTKSLLDPTPCFDSHISKNASKVSSLTSYRAFEHTQVHLHSRRHSLPPGRAGLNILHL